MMSYEDPPQSKLFYMGINIDKRIRKNHPLRKIEELIDFDFIYNEVKDKYGYNGNESIPPPVILKLMLLLVLYNVRSERELMDTLSERLDWLWFLGFDLDTEIPNHSVLSKARRRWGEEEGDNDDEGGGGVNSRYISTTDPDAAIVRASGKAKLRYETHRAVDSAYEVITAAEVTPGDVNEAHMMVGLIDSHQQNTETSVETVVADSKYG